MIALIIFLNGMLMVWMMSHYKAVVAIVAYLPAYFHSYYMYTDLFLLICNSLTENSSGTVLHDQC